MPTKTNDELLLRKNGTIKIHFDQTTIELGQIRNGQLLMLQDELTGIRDAIVTLGEEDAAAKTEVEAFNAEHADEDGFVPKEYTPSTFALLDYYEPLLRLIVETLGTTNARLPEDTATWPAWLTQAETLAAIFEAWRFNPLARGE